jgi:hypothetical protein
MIQLKGNIIIVGRRRRLVANASGGARSPG